MPLALRVAGHRRDRDLEARHRTSSTRTTSGCSRCSPARRRSRSRTRASTSSSASRPRPRRRRRRSRTRCSRRAASSRRQETPEDVLGRSVEVTTRVARHRARRAVDRGGGRAARSRRPCVVRLHARARSHGPAPVPAAARARVARGHGAVRARAVRSRADRRVQRRRDGRARLRAVEAREPPCRRARPRRSAGACSTTARCACLPASRTRQSSRSRVPSTTEPGAHVRLDRRGARERARGEGRLHGVARALDHRYVDARRPELELDREAMKRLELGALFHDIGKIGIPSEILQKPGPLTDEEFEIVKEHPELGEKILAPIERLEDVRPIVRACHERWDGLGYPDGKSGNRHPGRVTRRARLRRIPRDGHRPPVSRRAAHAEACAGSRKRPARSSTRRRWPRSSGCTSRARSSRSTRARLGARIVA